MTSNYFIRSEGSWGYPSYRMVYAISVSPSAPFKCVEKILEQDDKIAGGKGSSLSHQGNDEDKCLPKEI